MTFQSGDTVKLKSGGPAMTVSNVKDEKEVWCVWFDKDQNPKSHYFRPETLEKS